jgi:hypothetical protein
MTDGSLGRAHSITREASHSYLKIFLQIVQPVGGTTFFATREQRFRNSKAFNIAAGASFLSGGDNKYDINPGYAATVVSGASRRKCSGFGVSGIFGSAGEGGCLTP